MEREAAITVKGVEVTLGGVEILTKVYATIYKNELTALIGPNGAGKTTLLMVILDLIPYSGTIVFHPGYGHSPRIGYVPQHLSIERSLPLTVKDYLSLKIQKSALWLGYSGTFRGKINAALTQVGASHLEKRLLGKLSGGEFQRVSLAMALLGEPQILFLDEPGAGVDVMGEELFSELLLSLQKERNLTLVLVSHDLSLVNKYASQVICLNHCVHCQGKSAEVLTPETIARVYGAHLGAYGHKTRVIDETGNK